MKKTIKGIIAIGTIGSTIMLTGCPDINKAPIVKPVESPIKATEGLPFSTIFDVYDDHSTLEELIIEAEAQGFEDIETEKMPSNQAKVTGKPIDPNRSGPFNAKVKVTDLEGKSTTVVVPGVIEDTIDTMFFDLPEKIYATKGLPTSTFISKVLDDYSRFNGQGLILSIMSPDYTPEINYFTDGYSFSWRLVPKNTSIEPTHADFIVSDDEGNTKTVRVAIERMGLINHPPIIGEVPDVQTKEGQGGEFSLAIHDDYTPFDELLMYATSDDFHTALQALNGTVKIIYNPKDLNDNGLKKIKFTTIDGDGASSYKDIYVTISPMTDFHYQIFGNKLIYDDNKKIIGSEIVELNDATIQLKKIKVNEINHQNQKIILNQDQLQIVYEGKTDSTGNIKFKADPITDASWIYLPQIKKEGFVERDLRAVKGDKDEDFKQFLIDSNQYELLLWKHQTIFNNGVDSPIKEIYGFLIPNSNASWQFELLKDFQRPEVVLIIRNGQPVSEEIIDEVKSAIEKYYGIGMHISYDNQAREPFSNKIFYEFVDLLGGAYMVYPISGTNVIDFATIQVPMQPYDDMEKAIAIISHETIHTRLGGNSHIKEKYQLDSTYGYYGIHTNYPYPSFLDLAGLKNKEFLGNFFPGDKAIVLQGDLSNPEGLVIRFESHSMLYDGKIYYY